MTGLTDTSLVYLLCSCVLLSTVLSFLFCERLSITSVAIVADNCFAVSLVILLLVSHGTFEFTIRVVMNLISAVVVSKVDNPLAIVTLSYDISHS